MRARLGQERAAELARDDLVRGSREDVGLHGHFGPKSLPGARGGVNTVGASWGEVGVQRSGLQKGSSAPCSTLQPVRASRRRCCSGTHQICTHTQRGAQPRSNRRSDESRTSGSGQSAGQKVQDMRHVRGLCAPQHLLWRARVGLSDGWRRQPLEISTTRIYAPFKSEKIHFC